MANIKVRDLADTTNISMANQLMVLTNEQNNIVQNITVENFNAGIISSESDNGLSQDDNGKLFVNNADSGVVAGTYEYPKNLQVNSKGQILSVEQGQEANVPIATSMTAGIVKPDGLTIEITQDGTISSNNLGNEVGDIIWRLLPSNDAGKHLLDGSLIQGSGIYSAFVDYIAGLYEDNPTANYFAQGYTEELTFNQPVLSANGTLGGDSFAVSASSEYSSTYAIWKACNGVSSDINNGWVSQTHNGQYYIFYNPIPLKVTNISIQNGDTTARAILEWEVLGSNDNSTWETITTGVNSNTAIYAVWNINLSSNTNYYKYYKISAITDSGLAAICELGITATYQGATFTPEQGWQATVAQYGACGKFVYDSTNNTLRLPKVTGIVEGTIDATALGELIAAGLPNIMGNAAVTTDNAALMTGAFSWTRRTNNLVVYNPSGSYPWGTLTLDASQSSPIYGNSSTVQPQTIKGYYYIVVATSTKTDIQVDIDEFATDLNGKADTDLTNTTNQAKILMSRMVMPSNKYINLTLGASGATYTAPANGYIYWTQRLPANNGMWVLVNDNQNQYIYGKSINSSTTSGITIFLPVMKGYSWNTNYTGGTVDAYRFIYAQGSESEAS